jgi:UDP-N-acetylglucosamine--N-acetylmuramyl-(pentapeptide) pyrophosphoryl-undecaprenol N-acetylglucosamine transferase
MARPTYIFSGGGTGGHLYPGLAVAEALQARQGEALIVFACSNRSVDRAILDPTDHAIAPQPIRPLPKPPWAVIPFLHAWSRSNRMASRLIGDLEPRAVLGLGGFAAGPVVKVAASRSVPTALLNPDAVPGRANQYLARRVDRIFTQFASTAGSFAPAEREKVMAVGCPVRPGLAGADRDEAMRALDLSPHCRTLLVFGGSTLAESITRAMCELAEDLVEFGKSWQVLLVAGNLRGEALEAYSNLRVNVKVLRYCDRMDQAWAAADLAVTRGGAVTVAELTATATPAVILPYPHHADRQQELNAASLVEAGCARLVEDRTDPAVNAASLRAELLPLLRDSGRLSAMQQAADGLQSADAAGAVADWLVDCSPPER